MTPEQARVYVVLACVTGLVAVAMADMMRQYRRIRLEGYADGFDDGLAAGVSFPRKPVSDVSPATPPNVATSAPGA